MRLGVVLFSGSGHAIVTLRKEPKENVMETQQLTFALERETKNTVRYQEQTDGNPAVIGTVYIQKSTLGSKPPEGITVTISESNSGASE